MSTEKIIKSKSGWLFLLITIALFAVAALFLANFVLSAIAADRNPRLDPSFPSIIGALVFFFAGIVCFKWPVQPSAWSGKGVRAIW